MQRETVKRKVPTDVLVYLFFFFAVYLLNLIG